MPAPSPFPTPNSANALFPALYLYPLNDTWAPKHIALTNQHTKIGRQTSSKTAPGERNGFFDSKVLSRQHAEVWEEGGKIFIKDVKSSNGTFINGERLSSEGHESEPFELKSDDIVEFGIDIVGEDNKTIIHHKVAARVVCVFSDQDVQVAARAEQHQQQQQLQQQQYLQQASGSVSNMANSAGPSNGVNGGIVGGTIGVGGGAGGPQNFPFAAQRRAQLAQQGLGGMGGMRPPGKTGLSFDVILSRLQGELQKSRETGAELNSLTGAMGDIHDTLGGALPATLPPFPSTLPAVRPPQEANQPTQVNGGGSSSGSPEQPSAQPAPAVSATAILDLQSQLRDTQSSLASHVDKARALEGVLAEQEAMKREVRTLREMMEERRREMEIERAQQEERVRREVEEGRRSEQEEPRGGFDVEEEEDDREDDEDDDDDSRSVATAMPHELERVEEEDEEQLAEEERAEHRHEEEAKEREAVEEHHVQTEAEAHARAEAEEEARRIEDLGVGRPSTPEPRLSLLGAPRRSSMSSPLAHVSSSELRNSSSSASTDDVLEQVFKLSKQVGAVMALTTTLEAQHSAAQTTIQALETKVGALEEMLRNAEDALAKTQAQQPPPSPVKEVKEETSSLVDMMSEWKKSVEGQWGSVQEEWTHERERLSKAREEWESKVRQVDSGLEKMASLQTTLANQQQQIQVHLQHQQQLSIGLPTSHPFHHLGNGDALKHNSGLVTPPSPRSQSSDSGRYRRRRRRSSGSRGRSLSVGRSGSVGDNEREEDADTDITLASSTEDDIIEGKTRALGIVGSAERSLASPEPSVYISSPPTSTKATHSNSEDTNATSSGADWKLSSSSTETGSHPPPTINMQTAMGVVLLSVAAAAVFWKVKPE